MLLITGSRVIILPYFTDDVEHSDTTVRGSTKGTIASVISLATVPENNEFICK